MLTDEGENRQGEWPRKPAEDEAGMLPLTRHANSLVQSAPPEPVGHRRVLRGPAAPPRGAPDRRIRRRQRGTGRAFPRHSHQRGHGPRRARFPVAAGAPSLRRGGLPRRERLLARLPVALLGAVSGPRGAARRAAPPGAGAGAHQAEARSRLQGRVRLLPPRRVSPDGRPRGGRPGRHALLLLADGPRTGAVRADHGGAQPLAGSRARRAVPWR